MIFLPKILKRRHRGHVKLSDADSILPHPASDPYNSKLKGPSTQFRVDDVCVTPSRDLETSDLRHAQPRIPLCPSEDKIPDNASSLFEQTSHSPLSSVDYITEAPTTSSRTSLMQDTESVILDCSTASLADATSSKEDLISISTPSKRVSELSLTSILKSTRECKTRTLVTQISFDSMKNCTFSSSFDRLASIPPLQPTFMSTSITEILFLFDPLYTNSLSSDLEMSPVRQSQESFTRRNGSDDNVLVNSEEERVMTDHLESDPFKDPLFSYPKTIDPRNCRSNKKSSSLDKSSVINTLKKVVVPSAAKSVSFEPPLKLIGGTLSKWAHASVKDYENGDDLYRKRIKDHRIVEWRRYRVELRDFSGNRHEYVTVKLQHVRSKKTYFIRFERWRRHRYITFGGRSGRTIDWSPELDQVTIMADWVAVGGEKDTLVDRLVFCEDRNLLNLLDLYLVARLVLQVPGNCVELAGRSSHWFAVIFSSVLNQDVEQIERKYRHKRVRSALTGWLRESSREERDYALMLICEFRRELGVTRGKISERCVQSRYYGGLI
ncbi:hypothetical protein C0992_009605 [Termitomyces sp. T32_za158]|nr:hypothetical protein C0992_009605 [Termitomyces sp. T32_za158]